MGEIQGLMSLKHADVSVGQTIHWPIYNEAGQILFKSGVHVTDQQQLNHLLEVGYCDANHLWDSIPSKLPSLEQLSTKTTPDTTSKPAELNKESIVELDSVRWAVGEVFHLQTHDQAATRYTVRLIGYVKNKSLLVTAPTIDGRAASIREGQAFIIRAFPGKKAYAFTANLIKYVYTPFSYLHLSYPKQVRSTTIRQGARATVRIIASITIGHPEQTAAATLGDISMGGTSGILKKSIGKKGDTGVIKFKVNAAGNDEYLVLDVILRSVATTETGDEFRLGFEFINLTPQSRLILSAFVHQTLAEMD
ncbi:flagellar brake protein [Undibacterium sp. WLX3042]|uniref:flagellar brake protein n=1 Tax=Undibacterium sp. WLX3042 TaxID=3412686 RepID=UPI003C2DBDF2